MNNQLKGVFLSLFYLFSSISLFAQEQIGFHTDNYAGINSIRLNPTGYAQSPFGWDINLGEAGLFVDNNYVFIRPTSLLDLWKNGDNGKYIFAPDQKGEIALGSDDYLVDFKNDGKKRYVFQNAQIQGPSFFVKLNPRNYIGLHTGVRMASSLSGVTESLSYYTYDAIPFNQDIAIDQFNLGLLSWGEVGLNYIHKIPTQEGSLSIGATINRLTGFEAAYFYSDSDWSLQKLQGDSLATNATTLHLGYTQSNLSTSDFNASANGKGWSLDLGATYTIGEYEDGYDWKLGFSVLDLGRISFDGNATKHLLDTDNLVAIAFDNYKQYEDLEQLGDLVEQFSQDVLNDPAASFSDDKFNMWLPGAVSLQVERAFTPAFYLNATWVQGLPISQPGVRRGSVLALTPRLEKKWYGLSFPVSIYNYQRLRTGFALRLAFLTIGSDNLGSLVHKSDFYGTDFYMAIKLNPFGLQGLFKGSGGHKVRKFKGKGKDLKCYQF